MAAQLNGSSEEGEQLSSRPPPPFQLLLGHVSDQLEVVAGLPQLHHDVEQRDLVLTPARNRVRINMSNTRIRIMVQEPP